MKGKERRKEIVALIMAAEEPVSGTVLSEHLGVSRQIIVQDIAMLRAEGYDVLSTHQGYVIAKGPFAERVFKIRHTSEQTEDELSTIVSMGGTVVNVFVWHKVYGKITAQLNIFSRHQVKQFIEGVRTGKSTELMNITGGYHYHTIRADSEDILDSIAAELQRRDYIAPGI